MFKQIHSHTTYIWVAIIAVLSGCTGATRITDTWQSPDFKSPQYKQVFIAALIGDIDSRQTIENEMEVRLQQKGIEVVKSTEVFPPTFTEKELKNKEELLKMVNESQSDAILTISVIDEETDTRYMSDNVTYDPTVRFNFYGDFWGYYSHYSPQLYDPGYYAKDKIYFLETNLYDTGSEKLVWSAQSQSYNPADVDMFSSEVAQTTVEELDKDELI